MDQEREIDSRQPVPATDEEIARLLSSQEGRPVSVHEVRWVCTCAIHKLRAALLSRGYSRDDLI
ncbi:MAG: hypothetical protein KUL86_06940 [Castellaniella sp.]|nr:hypothetical protein [Castellaniella sp.]